MALMVDVATLSDPQCAAERLNRLIVNKLLVYKETENESLGQKWRLLEILIRNTYHNRSLIRIY